MLGETVNSGLTKHEQIIRHIRSLEINKKVSVRQIAKMMDVSEGTAYRAIKEAEAQGLVSSIPKVGTIRIQSEKEREIKELTLREIALIMEGDILTGQESAGVEPPRFVVGCNSSGVLAEYLCKDSVLVVGDILQYQRLALEKDAHLIVTGAFAVSTEILQEAEVKGIVIISCPYDTFEALAMVNRAVHDRLTDKELIYVEDIMVRNVHYLPADAIVDDWHHLSQECGHSRFPVVDQNMMVIGIVTAVDVAGVDRKASILSVMTTGVLTVERKTLVSHLSRALLWEGYELVPISENGRLAGVVSRQDILKAFQQTQKQPQFGETVDNLVMSGFKLEEWPEGTKITGEITQFMISEYGYASPGTLVTILSTIAYIAARKQLKLDTILDNLTLHHLEPVNVGDRVEVYAGIIHLEKKNCLLDISMYTGGELKVRGLISLRIIKK